MKRFNLDLSGKSRGADGTVPLGGVGQSGNGSDKSLHAIEKYINLKTAWIKL